MLITGASILLLLSVAFVGNAVRSLQEADPIAVTPIEGEWARLPVFVAELTGIHPTRRAVRVQARALERSTWSAPLSSGCSSGRRRRRPRSSGGRAGHEPACASGSTSAARSRRPPRSARRWELRAHAAVPTTHDARTGSRRRRRGAAPLARRARRRSAAVELVAYSTTTAMNALLEGDVARVGVVGIGAPDFAARASARVSASRPRAGATLHDRARLPRRDPRAHAGGGRRGARLGCGPAGARRSPSAAPSPSTMPEHERLVVERARGAGCRPARGTSSRGTYGLETRTVAPPSTRASSPVVERTAAVVGRSRRRGDRRAAAGAARRRRRDEPRGVPSRAVVHHRLRAPRPALPRRCTSSDRDGIVLECGGTSSNVSVVKGGRTVLRTLRVMGRPTSIRSIDAGSSARRAARWRASGGRKIEEVGPRSAHVAGSLRLLRATDDLAGAPSWS